jgi:hypothetical protein
MIALKTWLYGLLLASFASGTVLMANAAGGLSDAKPAATLSVSQHLESVLGKRLADASGENAGRIVDVLVDGTGQVRAAIVDYGGFLGIGSRKIAISWSDLRFAPDGSPDAVAVEFSRERLARAPQVVAGQPVAVVGARRPVWHRAARK